MFQGFTQETSAFLWDLSFHNERTWFLEHKEQFERCLNEPFKALAAETAAQMRACFPEREWRVHVSRIYRDARRLFGRGPYKDHLWFTVWSDETDDNGPAFWFEIGPATFEYGVGFFQSTPAAMETFRRMLDANPARFERIAEELAHMRGLRILGPEYKRPKGVREGILGSWYNRRWLAVEWVHDFGGALLTPQLPETLTKAWGRLMPLYTFFLEVYQAAAESAAERS